MQEYTIVNNKKLSRFEIALDSGEYAILEYRWLKGNMALMHTFVPSEVRTKGIGAMLVKYALEYAIENNLQILPYCPFVAKYIKLHPEFQDLVAPDPRR